MTRTPDPRIRNPLLYPAELRAQKAFTEGIASAGGRKLFCARQAKPDVARHRYSKSAFHVGSIIPGWVDWAAKPAKSG